MRRWSGRRFFGAKILELPWKDAEKDEPEFLADEIYEAIKVINFNANPILLPR